MKSLQQYAALAILIITLFANDAPFANAQQSMTVEVGLSERLVLPGQPAEIVIGSPDIADLFPVSANVYVLHANRIGTTNIMALDDNAEVIFYTRLNVRPVDIRPNFTIGVTRGTGGTQTYDCSPRGGCKAAGLGGPCLNPDDIAADGTRCGDRAASVQPGGLDGEGQPENAEPPAEAPAEPAG